MFKTPEKKSVGSAPKSNSTLKSASKKSSSGRPAMSKQHSEQIVQNLRNGAYSRAFRGNQKKFPKNFFFFFFFFFFVYSGLSTLLAGNFKPDRKLYKEIWRHMLTAQNASDAHQCFEALKLLQSTFPCVPGDEAASGWCPREPKDFKLLLECLHRTGPQEEGSERKQILQFPEFIVVKTQHNPERCPIGKSGKLNTREMLSESAEPCRKAFGCVRVEEPSPFYPLLLRFLVQLLTEDARMHGAADYGRSAAMALFLPRDANHWAQVAATVVEGIGSQLLSRDVSDSYFALLHLLVDVCGHSSNSEREKFVEIWWCTAGTSVLEASSQNVNDSLAELLQRSQWHSMKLTWVNFVLMTRFDSKEVMKKTRHLLEDPQNKSKLGEKLVHVYFWLKAKIGGNGDAKDAEMEDRSFDNESLVIFVASAWQSARVLADQNPILHDYLMSHKQEIRTGFEFFDARIKKLSVLRGTKNKSENLSERVVMYMTLLRAIIESFLGEAGESSAKKLKQ